MSFFFVNDVTAKEFAKFEEDPAVNQSASATIWRDGNWVKCEVNMAGKVVWSGDWMPVLEEFVNSKVSQGNQDDSGS